MFKSLREKLKSWTEKLSKTKGEEPEKAEKEVGIEEPVKRKVKEKPVEEKPAKKEKKAKDEYDKLKKDSEKIEKEIPTKFNVGKEKYKPDLEEIEKPGDIHKEPEYFPKKEVISEPLSADLLEEANSAKNTKEGINSFFDSLIELEKRDKTNRNKVTLSTIHSAKGLEWSHVFLVNCNEKTLPFYRGNSELTSTKRDSELRLFYVALSRAKNSLTITHSDYNQWGSELAPSQFLDILEIEEDESMKDNGWDKVQMIEI